MGITKMKEKNEMVQVEQVKIIFNQMVEEYDHLRDLWYSYTFGNIDKILLSEFRITSVHGNKPLALDIGCGTGIQSLRLATLGYKVIGIDIADKLLKLAKVKLSKAGYHDAEFIIGDAQFLPFEDEIASAINCCGPTLSFIPNWRKALSEIARCLKPGGKLLLEVEGKWNLDLFWEIINALMFNLFKYDEPLTSAISHLLPPWDIGHTITYSFKTESGESILMPLKLFATKELKRELEKVGLIIDKQWGLHVLTNLIPSTILHESNYGKLRKRVFNALAYIEQHVNMVWPFNAFGCSLLVLAHKQDDALR